MIFLGWDQPLLHSTADWLLGSDNIAQTPDLSGVIVVVRGRRAGRRLMELLALKCSEKGSILVPPEILTPSRLVFRLTQSEIGEPQRADSLACALAWAQAINQSAYLEQERLFRRPGIDKSPMGLVTSLGLGRHLHQLWSQLGGDGISFADVRQVLAERFPHVADFEIPRWEELERLHEVAAELLHRHDLIDPTDLLIRKARTGKLLTGKPVLLIGVAQMPRIVAEFLRRLPTVPTPLIFAPESEREGFDKIGLLKPGHWENRKIELESRQIHAVERDRDQALRTTQIVKMWRDGGIALDQITIAVPDMEALPRMREALEGEHFIVRSAQGRLVSDSPAFQLLRLVSAYLDHAPQEPPRFEAVAALARHPDIPGINSRSWRALDQFSAMHLPSRFAPDTVVETSEEIHRLHEVLHRVINIGVEETDPIQIAAWVQKFLINTYGDRQEKANSPEGRVAVQGLKLLCGALLQTNRDFLPWPKLVRPADFISIILSFLGEQPVPEPAAADALPVVGWLELIEDDAPAVVVTSFYEGAVPESVSSDPFLPGSLRQALSLSDNTLRFARDAYALAAVVGSRADGRGAIALIAPRFDSGENPTRPSRLLLAGLKDKQLARRVWHLAGRRSPEAQQQLKGGRGFSEALVETQPAVESIHVTAFRKYIESPRKFYFENIMRVRSEDDSATELQPFDVGNLLHEVVAAFGADSTASDSSDERIIEAFVLAKFDQVVRDQFGPWAQTSVEGQIVETRKRLAGFVQKQAALRKEGWIIRFVEGSERIQCDLAVEVAPQKIRLTGKIDRIDYHATTQKWRIIDYKTSAKGSDPHKEHRKRSGEWKDLQLPLYLKLAAPYALTEWGVALTPDNCDLCYFQLPEEEENAGISKAFPADMVEEAWNEAARLAAKIMRGEFAENPPLNPERNDPALLGLCGQIGIVSSEPVIVGRKI